MNEVISNPLPEGGKTIHFKVVNLDSPIRVQTVHNEYLSCSPDQGQQFLRLGFLIGGLEKNLKASRDASKQQSYVRCHPSQKFRSQKNGPKTFFQHQILDSFFRFRY